MLIKLRQPWAWCCSPPWWWSSPPRPGCGPPWTSSCRHFCLGASLPGSQHQSPSCPGPGPPGGEEHALDWLTNAYISSLKKTCILRIKTKQKAKEQYKEAEPLRSSLSAHLQPLVLEGLLGLLPGPARPACQQPSVLSHPAAVGVRRGADLSVCDQTRHHPQHPWAGEVCGGESRGDQTRQIRNFWRSKQWDKEEDAIILISASSAAGADALWAMLLPLNSVVEKVQ